MRNSHAFACLFAHKLCVWQLLMDGLKKLLDEYKSGGVDQQTVLEHLKNLPYEDLGFAKVDHHRQLRTGHPEVIFCQGKTTQQIAQIAQSILNQSGTGLLATRADREAYDAVLEIAPDAQYNQLARVITVKRGTRPESTGVIGIVTAGSADLPVSEEAAETAIMLGNKITRIYDVGVAGIHRLFAQRQAIEACSVLIVAAGMEGALASVLGGMTAKPVIAVPTSVGYGASFNGLAALLAMLNSCAAGVGVMNIDNGFGAACLADKILRVNG